MGALPCESGIVKSPPYCRSKLRAILLSSGVCVCVCVCGGVLTTKAQTWESFRSQLKTVNYIEHPMF